MKELLRLRTISFCALIPQGLLWSLLLWMRFGTDSFLSLPEGLYSLCSYYFVLYGSFGSFLVAILGTICAGMYTYLTKLWWSGVLTAVHALLGFGAWYSVIGYLVHVT